MIIERKDRTKYKSFDEFKKAFYMYEKVYETQLAYCACSNEEYEYIHENPHSMSTEHARHHNVR